MQRESKSNEKESANVHLTRVTVRRPGEAKAASQEAKLINVSRKRATVCVAMPLRFQEQVELRIEDPSNRFECDMLGAVRLIRAAADGKWDIACELDPPMDDRVISRLVKKTGLNRRRHPRERMSLGATVFQQLGVADANADLRNVSQRGFCVRLNGRCEVEEQILVTIEKPGSSAVVIKSRVQWLAQKPNGVFAGCRFLCPDDYAVLRDAARLECAKESPKAIGKSKQEPRIRAICRNAVGIVVRVMERIRRQPLYGLPMQ